MRKRVAPEGAKPREEPKAAQQPAAWSGRVQVRSEGAHDRTMHTVRPDSPWWSEEWEAVRDEVSLQPLLGALVRLQPPARATDGRMQALEQALRQAGAAAVKVDAKRHGDVQRAAQPEVVPVPLTITELVDDEIKRRGLVHADKVRAHVLRALDAGRAKAPPSIVPESSAPLYVSAIRAENWFRFGSVDVKLGPEAYALVAHAHDDAGRSNYLGKSTFLATIPFVLTGQHPAPNDDAWIRRGQSSGFVELDFSDGSTARRGKAKGGVTKVTFDRADGRKLQGDDARAALSRFVGLTAADYFASAFVRQKELARLVASRSSDVMKIVSAWLELAPLRAAHTLITTELGQVQTNETVGAGLVQALNDRFDLAQEELRDEIKEWRDQLDGEWPADAPAWDVAAWLETYANKAHMAVAGEIAVVEQANRWEVANAMRVATERVAEDALGALRTSETEGPAKVAALTMALEAATATAAASDEKLRTAMLAEDSARRDANSKLEVAAGLFDGRCPVAGIDCPAKVEINANRTASQARSEEAQLAWATARGVAAAARAACCEPNAEVLRLRGEIDAIRGEHERLMRVHVRAQAAVKALGEPPVRVMLDRSNMTASAAELAERVSKFTRLSVNAKRLANELRDVDSKLEKTEQAHEVASRLISELRQAALVLGPAGILKRWAVGELARIERGANDLLTDVSRELRVAIQWGYPSETALEASCSSCGSGYSATSRAKTCPVCSAARGPRIEEEVRIELTERSGAAEDMAGLAVQIAASAWLRESRGSAWRSIAIDEPFGALDRTHARAMGVQLAQLLAGRHGFLQSFVVAHDQASLDAFPSRIEITGCADGTSVVRVLGSYVEPEAKSLAASSEK